MRFLAGMFAQRTPTNPPVAKVPPLPPSDERAQRWARLRRDAARQHRARAEAQAAAGRAELEQLAERHRTSVEDIERACATLGHWWPGTPRPEGRLTGRPSWRAKVIEAIRVGWDAARRGY